LQLTDALGDSSDCGLAQFRRDLAPQSEKKRANREAMLQVHRTEPSLSPGLHSHSSCCFRV